MDSLPVVVDGARPMVWPHPERLRQDMRLLSRQSFPESTSPGAMISRTNSGGEMPRAATAKACVPRGNTCFRGGLAAVSGQKASAKARCPANLKYYSVLNRFFLPTLPHEEYVMPKP
jgi:hypothetical protein